METFIGQTANPAYMHNSRKKIEMLSLCMPLWRNWLARSAVNRKDGGSSPPRGAPSLVTCKAVSK